MKTIPLLVTLAAAQDLTGLLNPKLSTQCLLAINARTQTVTNNCLSPYDLGVFASPPSDMVKALVFDSFSFVPTFCSGLCTMALNQFRADVSQVCKDEVIVDPKFSGAYPAVLKAMFFPTPNTTSLPPAQQQAVLDAYNKQVGPILALVASYFNSFSTAQTIDLVKGMRNIFCVKDSDSQADQTNLLDNKYCIKRQLATLAAAKVPLSGALGFMSTAIQTDKTGRALCDVCLQYEAAQVANSVALVSPLTIFSDGIANFTKTQNVACPNLKQVSLQNTGFAATSSVLGSLFIAIALVL
ncbi:hypothetical protein HDV03_001615 [Kappamyces sp. JEL0829]|nr:hypothetical protein HDV03_001615 [Kappamyces sp. JEL0829]